MAEQCLFAGIDVSKKKLDLAIRLEAKKHDAASFANSKKGIQRLIKYLLSVASTCRIVLEPTSRYHVAVMFALAATPGCEVMAVNPRQARRFREGRGGRAKTDGLDARSLADMASQLDHDDEFFVFVPPSANRRELQLLGRQVAAIAVARSKVSCRISSYPTDDEVNADAIASNERMHCFYQEEIIRLLQLMLEIVLANDQLTEIYNLLIQIRGIGNQSVLQLMGELLVLPKGMGPRQWAAIAGLDPRANQSGTSNLPARISKMGNRYLKNLLFMAAWNTTQFEPHIKEYYRQFHERKGSKMLALVVVMRRLLHGIWHMLQRMVPFDPTKCFALKSS